MLRRGRTFLKRMGREKGKGLGVAEAEARQLSASGGGWSIPAGTEDIAGAIT